MNSVAGKVLVAGLLTLLSGMAMVLLLRFLGPDWTQYEPATCTLTRCFCELPQTDTLIVQPANAWSSLGFTFIGFLIILFGSTKDSPSAFTPLASVIFGAAAIVVGLGSVLLHATLTLWGQFFDVFGMYLVSVFLLIAALAKWRAMPDRDAAVYYLILCAALTAVLIAMPEVRRWLYAVVLVLAIFVELVFARPNRDGVQTRYYLTAFLLNAIAFAFWNLDQHGQMCDPNSWLQGHAIWHLLGAIALWFVYLYYRSEQRPAFGR